MSSESEQLPVPYQPIAVGPTIPTYHQSSQLLWLWWVAATVIGSLIGQAVWLILPKADYLYYLFVVIPAFIGALAQWFVLRRCLPQITLWSWAGFTIIGNLASALVALLLSFVFFTNMTLWLFSFDFMGMPISYLIRAALLSALAGSGQWLILRRFLSNAFWWVVARATAGAVIFIVPLIVRLPEPPMITASGQINYGNMAIASLIGSFESGIIVGAITGLALVWLLRRTSNPSRSLTPKPAE